MGFSKEWETAYSKNTHLSVWPWSHVISLTHRYCDLHEGMKVLELGCGAGANVPYFISLGVDYYGLEGSETMVRKLSEQFFQNNCHFAQADFTKSFFFENLYNNGGVDVIIDRSSVTHNSTEDIKKVVELSKKYLKCGGIYIGMDWFSTENEFFKNKQYKADVIDSNTLVFKEGYFNELGNVHFSDEKHIREIFKDFRIEFLEHKLHEQIEPYKINWAWWDFVVTKK
ncbi:MAG: class I SAM-dependent methyltransferase [Spirochaetales bacterium]|nr:class I SAM-dependent methyltransferase [Spirochaetales bacterium]